MIRSREALRTISHVLRRIYALNCVGYFPVRIEEMGVAGSSLRAKHVRDVDVIVIYTFRDEILPEWREFMSLLFEERYLLWHLLSQLKGRKSIDGLIKCKRKELINLGFKPRWVESWLK